MPVRLAISLLRLLWAYIDDGRQNFWHVGSVFIGEFRSSYWALKKIYYVDISTEKRHFWNRTLSKKSCARHRCREIAP
jgi:hypothetical protein